LASQSVKWGWKEEEGEEEEEEEEEETVCLSGAVIRATTSLNNSDGKGTI
jgi:hypothetical protein